MGLFDNIPSNSNSGGAGGGGLFGNNNTTNQSSSTTGGASLFGNTTNNASTGGGGLFNTQPATTSSGGGLFGSQPAATSSNTGGGLFGSQPAASTNTGGGGLFGSNTAANTNTGGGGLFNNNNTTNNNAGTSSLFGGGNTNTANNNTSSLFGGQQQQNSGASMFGGNNAAGASMFGGGQATNGQNQNQGTLFSNAGGQNQQQQQQQQGPVSNASIFNPQTVSVGGLGHTMTNAQLQRLQFSGASTVPNEKKISEQIHTVIKKWNPDIREDPNSQTNPRRTTLLQTYLYNAVPKEYAPFFYPDASRGEDEKSWEEALSQKPELPEVAGQSYVPILVVGFKALGDRVETQAKIVQEMRSRLHEMNNSLSAVMDAHQQRITVKIAAAKRQHHLLSQRCLRLAVKVQVLRNRGYALDAQEEGLRKTLLSLERQVTDPTFIGREDEIWARMVSLRERARWLEEEGKRVANQVQGQQNEVKSAGVPEEILAKTRKILKDYDGQLQHLNKELEEVKKEFAAWEEIKGRR